MKTMNLTLMLLFLAVCSFAQNVPSYVPSNGLVGWWPFNGNANDESGNGNNGTVNGATLTSDRFGNAGKAYSFDGVDDFITLSSIINSNITGSYTISLWVSVFDSTNVTNGNEIIGDRDASTYNFRYRINYGISQQPFVQDSTYIGSFISNQSYELIFEKPQFQTWENYLIKYDFNNQSYYVYKNGLLIGSRINVPFEPNARQINLARSISPAFPSGVAYYNGKIDDIGIWNRALTQQEITNLYNGGICYQTITVTDTLLINTGITGFNPVTYENTIRIWPNPTYDHITIDAGDLNVMNGYSIRIVNALGQQMFQSAITQQQFYLDLSTWTGSGIYYVNIINAQGVTIDTRKIVLQ